MRYFGIYYVGEGAPRLCEVDGGVCYEAYRTAAEAEREIAATLPEFAERYTVKPIPAGTRVWDRESHSVNVATCETRATRNACATLFALVAFAAFATAPALGADVKPQSKIAQCGAVWKANKAALESRHGSWPRFWSACAAALKTGVDPVSAPAKARAACTTDSDCARRFGGNGNPAPAN